MSNLKQSVANVSASDADAQLSIRIGSRVAIEAKITRAGLFAIGALVSSILLSTSVIALVADRKPAKSSSWRIR